MSQNYTPREVVELFYGQTFTYIFFGQHRVIDRGACCLGTGNSAKAAYAEAASAIVHKRNAQAKAHEDFQAKPKLESIQEVKE